MPVNWSFERELAQLEALGSRALEGRKLDEDEIARVHKALGHPNNYLVAKAARIAADQSLIRLLPEALAAFDRFFVDAVTNDQQCWAKNALAKALVKLGCKDAAVYLRGLRHHQEEPVWGGHSDTAGALRGTCTQALAGCDGLSDNDILNLLLEPFVDLDKTVRVEAARAIGSVGGSGATLVLRLRILVRKEDPEVLGACFSALLAIGDAETKKHITLVAEYLDDGEEAAAEAAFALAETHHPAALAALIHRRNRPVDAWFSSVLDHAIALTRLSDGVEFLLGIIESDPRRAASALEAISRVYRSAEVRARVAQSIRRAADERVELAFLEHFPERATGS